MSSESDQPSATNSEVGATPYPEEIMQIRGYEVVQFFSEFDSEATCPVCGCEDLELMAAPEYDDNGKITGYAERPAIAGLIIDERPDLRRKMKSPAFVTSCDRCGYVSYILVSKFLAWKRKNEASK